MIRKCCCNRTCFAVCSNQRLDEENKPVDTNLHQYGGSRIIHLRLSGMECARNTWHGQANGEEVEKSSNSPGSRLFRYLDRTAMAWLSPQFLIRLVVSGSSDTLA